MKPDPKASRLIGARALSGRRVNEVFYPAGMRQARHRHDYPALSFVVSGRYRERIDRRDHDRTNSTLIYHPAGEAHAVVFESDVRIVSVELCAADAIGAANGRDRGASRRGRLAGWLGARLRREMTRADGASVLAIDGLIAEMLAEGARGRALAGESGTAAWLSRATDFVHDNFRTTLSLAEVAGVAGVHTAHLSRVFREKMGCTVGEYLRRLRFEFACRRILSTETPLSAIAYDAGFADQSHFNRLFRAQMGVTPKRYRDLHRRR